MSIPKLTLAQASLVLVAVALMQLRFNAGLPLDGDEAYYWAWSRHLAPGYHDHPPMIALMIWAATHALDVSAFAIRSVATLCLSGACLFVWRITDRVYGGQAATLALGGALILPVIQMGMTLATPDAPQALFWAAGASFGLDAVTGQGRWRDFLLAGLFAGLAMASKYTAVLLPLSVFLVVLIRRRALLTSPKLWCAVGVAVLVFSPVLWWNIQNGLESFSFQYNHGAGVGHGLLWREWGIFLAGQAALLSPVVLGLAVVALARWRDWWPDDRRLYLVVCFAAPMALFVYKALFAKMQLNWSAPALLTLLPFIAGYIYEKRLRLVGIAAALVSVAMVVALKWPLAVGLTGTLNIQNRLFGPEAAARALQDLRLPGDAIFADHLTRAALLEFLLPGHPEVHIPTETRFSEYTRWDRGLDWTALHGLYLSRDERTDEVTRVFGKAELVQVVTTSRLGTGGQKYFIYRVN